MGTSKGYIAPSTPQWSQAKRGVSSYANNPTAENKSNATSKYAKAMNSGGYNSSRVSNSFSGFANFILASNSVGYEDALRTIGREDILSMNPEDAISELTLHFANNGETIDDAIALDCISETLEVLDINKIEDFNNVDMNIFLKEMACQFAKQKFAQLFDKQIRNKCPNIEQANMRISDIQEYIYYTLESNLTPEILITINPQKLSNESIVQEILDKAFDLMEQYYGD